MDPITYMETLVLARQDLHRLSLENIELRNKLMKMLEQHQQLTFEVSILTDKLNEEAGKKMCTQRRKSI